LVCLNDLKLWLSRHFLNLNENKMEIILFGPKEYCELDVDYAPYEIQCARNMGILFDQNLKFHKQISTVVKSCFFIFANSLKRNPFYPRVTFKQWFMLSEQLV